MRVVASTIFCLMMFPHDGKIVTVDQLTYHNPQGLTTPANDIPTVNTIIDEGASMCAMSTLLWQKLGSPILQPSTSTLWAYDGHPTKYQGILPHIPITLAEKIVLIDIEVGNAKLDYKLLLGRSYMYTMKAIT